MGLFCFHNRCSQNRRRLFFLLLERRRKNFKNKMPKQMMQQIPQFMNKKNLGKIGGGDLGLSIQSHLHLLIAAAPPLPINSKCRKKNRRYCCYLLQIKLQWKCPTLCLFYLPYLFSKFNFNRHFFYLFFLVKNP